jgi:hypothetical protein
MDRDAQLIDEVATAALLIDLGFTVALAPSVNLALEDHHRVPGPGLQVDLARKSTGIASATTAAGATAARDSSGAADGRGATNVRGLDQADYSLTSVSFNFSFISSKSNLAVRHEGCRGRDAHLIDEVATATVLMHTCTPTTATTTSATTAATTTQTHN